MWLRTIKKVIKDATFLGNATKRLKFKSWMVILKTEIIFFRDANRR